MFALSDLLDRISDRWVPLAAAVVFALFVAFVLPAHTTVGSGDGAAIGSPDLSVWYSGDDLYAMADAYGADGRADYVRARLTFDIVWPFVYVAFLSTALSWVHRRRLGGAPLWRRANLLPVAGGVFDLLENAGASLVMLRYPDRTPVVDSLTPLMTTAKWVTLAVCFLLLVFGLVSILFRWTRRWGRVSV